MSTGSKILIMTSFVLVVLLGFWLGNISFQDDSSSQKSSENVPIGGTFALKDPDGNSVKSQDFPEKILAVYFGYAHCPDICPTAMTNLTEALTILKEDASKIQPFFVTVDPGRDAPEILKAFLEPYDSRIIALLGSDDELEQIKKDFRVYADKDHTSQNANGDKDYLMNHSSLVYLVTPGGKYLGHFSHDTSSQEMAKKMSEVIARTKK